MKRGLSSAVALASVAAIALGSAAATPPGAMSPEIRVAATQVELAALTDINTAGIAAAWSYSYGSEKPSVCNFGGAPICQYFGSPTYPNSAGGAVYYLLDNLLGLQDRATLLDVVAQFGPGAGAYAAAYAGGLGPVADAIFLAPQLLTAAVVKSTSRIPVIGPLTKAYLYGIWDVTDGNGGLVSVDSGFFQARAVVEFVLDLIRGSAPLSTLLLTTPPLTTPPLTTPPLTTPPLTTPAATAVTRAQPVHPTTAPPSTLAAAEEIVSAPAPDSIPQGDSSDGSKDEAVGDPPDAALAGPARRLPRSAAARTAERGPGGADISRSASVAENSTPAPVAAADHQTRETARSIQRADRAR